ncbi:MAG: YlqD family protein [Veillonella sp.]|nr:YlqD family protein [Veillonella sp.]MCF0158051.1 YlqD family protein [Veillonella sp.]
MEEMKLRVPVAVKAVVTELLKERMITDLEERLQAVEQDLMQIEFQAQRLMSEQAKLDPNGLAQISAQIEEQKQRANSFKAEVTAKLEEVKELSLGTELPQGQLDQVITVKVGDNLDNLMVAEILLEDGVVKAFRG